MRSPELVTAINAITATGSSIAIPMADVQKLTVIFTEAGAVLNRSGVLTITASFDGTNFFPFNMLIDNAAGASALSTTIANKTRAAAGTDLLGMNDAFPIKFIKATVTITDGATPAGNFTVQLYKKYDDALN